jgi:ribonucleoside-triphosphate reductase
MPRGQSIPAGDLSTITRRVLLAFCRNHTDRRSIQDLVEDTLVDFGYFKVAKAYVLYRAEHAKIRQARKT